MHVHTSADEVLQNDAPCVPVPGYTRATSPEQELVLAVIDQAVADLECVEPWARGDARAWCDSGDEELFTFVWCCEALGLDPNYARANLHRWRAVRINAGHRTQIAAPRSHHKQIAGRRSAA